MAVIWHLSVIQNSRSTLVSGVILNMKKSIGNTNRFRAFAAIPASYGKKRYANKVIRIGSRVKYEETKTDNYGAFYIKSHETFTSGFKVFDESMNEIKGNQSYPVFFKQNETGRLVISDIDDTIMRSFTKTKLKRLITTLSKPASKRLVIPYTQQLYKTLGLDADFYYVSKSENNLFRLISDFILHHNLPIGPLFLTPFLNFSELILNKKDKAFKKSSICFILDHAINENIILIGDDTQLDMSIYTEIVNQYGNRIEKVYIRQTRTKRTIHQTDLWNTLNQTGVHAVYFKNDEIFNP